MNAVVFHEHGGPDRLCYQDVETPAYGPEDVLVRVKACALNHLDLWIRQGIPSYRIALPHISGSDVAGTIEAVGDRVEGLVPGARVFLSPGLSCWACDQCRTGQDNLCSSFKVLGAQVDGGYAEYVVVPAVHVLPLPASVSFEEGAAFPLVSLTAWNMVFAQADLRPGETVLVMGGGSGVGSMAIQLAKFAGARVFTTVGIPEKMDKARGLGAEAVLNHSKDDLIQEIKSLTGGRGVDVVIEHIGPQVLNHCLAVLAKGGRLVTCGATTGGEVTLDLRFIFSRQLTVKGAYLGTRGHLLKAAALVGEGRIRPHIDRVFPLQDARVAQEYLLSRQVFGKVVLSVN